jgi:hypothetical protein
MVFCTMAFTATPVLSDRLEEVVDKCSEEGSPREIPKFDGASAESRAHMARMTSSCGRSAQVERSALPVQDHIAEVPVPPPEA